MCGIAGYISLNNNISAQQLTRAANKLQHRGPDAAGYFFSPDKQVGLAHRRLSILDLSTSANQPMFSADGRYVIVFNGEVYNFKELKRQLKNKGAALKTTSDTEVILELFAQNGPACLAELNGMFVFAIYDQQTGELTLCRDHVGIKPLFYYQDEHLLAFGSELKAVAAMVQTKLQINHQAIPYFLHLGFIPEPLTIYRNTHKFPAAHYVQVNTRVQSFGANAVAPLPFWSLAKSIQTETLNDELTAKVQLDDLLHDAIEKQLVSDVPVGTFLSGGVDSSLVTAIAADIAGSKAIKTFSIAIDTGKHNESTYARQVAKHLHTDHHVFSVKEKEVAELVNTFLPAFDEPFADASAFPTMMVSRLAKKEVTVALSGDGGDELFHGYNMYSWAARLSTPFVDMVKSPIYNISRLMNSRYQRIGKMFAYPHKKNIISHIFSQDQYHFMEQELDHLLVKPVFDFSGINQSPVVSRSLNAIEKQSFWDFEHYLKDDLLVKVDRASMQYSLESRVPLLDYRLVEFAFNLDAQLKIKDNSMKYLLKQVLYDYVPRQIFERPKWGFSIPLNKWLKTDLKYLLDQYTSEAVISKHNIVHFSVVKEMKEKYLKGIDYLFTRLWLIVILHWWLEENSMAKSVQPDE